MSNIFVRIQIDENSPKYRLKEIMKPIRDFCDFSPIDHLDNKTPADNETAKNLLLTFFKSLKSIDYKPFDYEDAYKIAISSYRVHNYYSFWEYILKMRKYFLENNYIGVCDELLRINYYEDILQQRIHQALLFLYHTFMEENNEKNF